MTCFSVYIVSFTLFCLLLTHLASKHKCFIHALTNLNKILWWSVDFDILLTSKAFLYNLLGMFSV